MYITLQPLVALIAGILILMIPRLLNYIVAIYLIVIGSLVSVNERLRRLKEAGFIIPPPGPR